MSVVNIVKLVSLIIIIITLVSTNDTGLSYIDLHGEEISKYASDLSEAKRLLKLYKKTEKGEAYMLWYKETYGK